MPRPPWRLRIRGLCLCFCLGAIAFPACSERSESDSGGEAPHGRGRVVIGVRGDVTSFNIYTATNAFSQEIADLLYLKLAAEQDDFSEGPPSFKPALASSWRASPDGLSLAFTLDPNARWSDGRAVTSADIVFSYKAAVSGDVGWVGADVKELISRVEAPDEHTVVFTFSKAYPYRLMDAAEGNVMPAHLLEPIQFSSWPTTAFLEASVVSGPFRLKRYERGAFIELARNEAYSKAPLPRLESVVFRIIPDEATLVNELLSGGIEFMENLPESSAARVEAAGRHRLIRIPDLSYTFVCWNTSRPPFDDVRVRQALSLAIDRRALIEGLIPKTGRPSTGPILSFMWAHDRGIPPPAFDLAAARGALAQAGFADRNGDGILERAGRPFRFDLEVNQGSGLRMDVAQMIAAQLRKAGVEATPRVFEFGAFVERHEKGEFDAFVASWRESTKVDLKSVFHSASVRTGYNYGRYISPELDSLIDEARAENEPSAARALWKRAQAIIVRDQPYAFLFERDRLHAAARTLRGVRPVPRSAYAGLEEWHVAGGVSAETAP